MSVRGIGYRLSPQQKRAWQLLLANHGNGCIVEGALLIEGRIEPSVIEELLNNIAQRHEILRTEFRALPGASIPVQVIAERRFRLEKILDLSHLDEVGQGAEVEKLKQESRRPFLSFEQGALIRATLIILSTEKKLLLVSLPALCADRAGLANLALELGRNHSGMLGQEFTGNGVAQYVDLAGILNGFLELDEMQEGREYWRTQINEELFDVRLPNVALTSDRQIFLPKFISRRLYSNSGQNCDGAGLLSMSSHSASVYLLACYSALLYRLTGSLDLMIGTAYSVRSYKELAGTIGPLEKYLPIRCLAETGTTLADLIQQLGNNCQEAEVWQESFTLEHVKGASEREQKLLFFPFQFEYWEIPDAISIPPVRITLIEAQSHLERFDVKLCCVRNADTFDVQVHYDPSVSNHARIGQNPVPDCRLKKP